MLADEDCDPDLLAIGIRAPKLNDRQRRQNRYRNRGGGLRDFTFGKPDARRRHHREDLEELSDVQP